jgi:hypothetical protein
VKLWDDITPDTHHNKARAIMEDEKRRNQLIEENKKGMEEMLNIRIGRNLFTLRTFLGGEK